ncbi:MAG: class I SAM-dependent methyltransferase [Candidatus Bipolaricaulia bacterium]
MKKPDKWAEWLIKTRFQHKTEEQRRKAFQYLSDIRGRVLDRSEVKEGDVVLDVGTGIGLLAFGAVERVRPTGQVIASDISVNCLEECRRLARQTKVDRWMEFLQADATALNLPDESVDVIMTRSVLIYVQDKRKVAEEFFRVLRPGGRFSIFEPINSRRRVESDIDWAPVQEIKDRLDQRRRELSKESPTIQAMISFDEQDLLGFFEQVGFIDLNLDLRQDTALEAKTREEAISLLKGVGSPDQKSIHDLLIEEFPHEKVEAYVEYFASQVERHPYRVILPVAYLSGRKPFREK